MAEVSKYAQNRTGTAQQGDSYTLPAPVSGLNSHDPVDLMDESFAVAMDNFFPDTGTVKVRNGYREWTDGMGSGAVQFVQEFNDEDGTRQVICGANNKLYNASTFGVSATDITGAAVITSNKWQAVNFKGAATNGRMIFVNGADQPLQWDGTTLSAANYTGIANDADLINVSTFRERLYFTEVDSTSVWYGGVQAVTGALTEFNVGAFLRLGGHIVGTTAWSSDLGSGLQEVFVILSSRGEVLMYTGEYPGSGAWWLTARYTIPAPIGRRAIAYTGRGPSFITEIGLIPIESIFEGPDSSGRFTASTDRVREIFRDRADAHDGNFGWEGTVHPRGRMAVMNIPLSGTTSEQLVVNTETGAWCRFTGINAATWGVFDDMLMFGGMDGKIYQADWGSSDAGMAIDVKLKQAFNYLDERNKQKHFTLARPLFIGAKNATFVMDVDVDFEHRTLDSTVTITGALGEDWDIPDWDTAEWDDSDVYHNDWHSIHGVGRAMALRIEGRFINAPISLSATQVIYEPGGYL